VAKQKVAVLGGGCGALSAAFSITSKPNWQDEYEVTVYQMGWRLGGKGASGRGADGRIEEHGLHVWMGFYNNAFRVMQTCYKEMNRPTGTPLATWQDAFKQHNLVVIAEHLSGGKYSLWPIVFPTNDGVPGDGTHLDSLYAYISPFLSALHANFKVVLETRPHLESPASQQTHAPWYQRLVEHLEGNLAQFAETHVVSLMFTGAEFEATRADPEDTSPEGVARMHRVVVWLDSILEWISGLAEPIVERDPPLRHFALVVNLAAAAMRGFLSEHTYEQPDGLDRLDRYDFREFLLRYGAADWAVNSGEVQSMYDLVFGYEDGDPATPRLAAGVAIRGMLLIAFAYHGSIFWKMQAGMGDTVFTPLHRALAARGVNFEFFHKVLEITPDEKGEFVDSVRIQVQATPKEREYDPYVRIKDLDCWPSEPLFDQLVEGEALRNSGQNLESHWSTWAGVGEKTLKVGEDFDWVVLGIPVGSLPFIAPKLIAINPRWKAMADNLKTTRTLSAQLWFTPNLVQMGNNLSDPMMAGYAQPFNTWADMTHLIEREDWPTPPPGNLAYLCGPMKGGIPPEKDTQAPERAYYSVQFQTQTWLDARAGLLWPKAATTQNPAGLNFNLLYAKEGGDEETRFTQQYFRANIDPNERYVLSLPGTTQYRLHPKDTGFRNLTIAGDWTWNYINAGCVEASVISGMLASRAVCDWPPEEEIVGLGHL